MPLEKAGIQRVQMILGALLWIGRAVNNKLPLLRTSNISRFIPMGCGTHDMPGVGMPSMVRKAEGAEVVIHAPPFAGHHGNS